MSFETLDCILSQPTSDVIYAQRDLKPHTRLKKKFKNYEAIEFGWQSEKEEEA